MSDDEVARAVRALGEEIRVRGDGLDGSFSSSGVYRVTTDGREAVLKVTAADAERPNARRELAFYQSLASPVPVTTPTLLDSADTEDITALLLTAHTPSPPAAAWEDGDWLDVAGQLAALHSTPPPDLIPWPPPPVNWLERALARPPPRKVRRYWTRAGAAAAVGHLLEDRAALAQALNAVGSCLTHGDCHADNLLRDGTCLVWTDWQAVGIGSPAGDLAFLWSRANADGADLPREAMLREYLNHSDVDPALMHRALTATELCISLYGWPDYARFHAPDERDRITRRFLDLENSWREVRAA